MKTWRRVVARAARGRGLGLDGGAEADGGDQGGSEEVTTVRFHSRDPFKGDGWLVLSVAAKSGGRLCLILRGLVAAV